MVSKKIVTDDTEVNGLQSPEVQNEWRNVVSNPTKKKKLFISQNLCPYFRYLYGLVKEKKTEELISNFWVFNVTILRRELHDSRVVVISHESDIK